MYLPLVRQWQIQAEKVLEAVFVPPPHDLSARQFLQGDLVEEVARARHATAMASTWSFAPLPGSAATATVERAGSVPVKYSA